MNSETILEWLRRQPFEPFELRLSNGQMFQIRHPENMALGKNRVAIYNLDTDQFAHVATIHINSIQALQTAN